MERQPKIKGFHGRGEDLNSQGCAITEGRGVYVAHAVEFAQLFGSEIEVVEYFEPQNPLIVDNESLYLLVQDPEIFEPIREKDSIWTKLNKQALKVTPRDMLFFDRAVMDAVSEKLSELILADGYDAVRVTFREMIIEGDPCKWDVLMNENLVIKRYPLAVSLPDPAPPVFCESLLRYQSLST